MTTVVSAVRRVPLLSCNPDAIRRERVRIARANHDIAGKPEIALSRARLISEGYVSHLDFAVRRKIMTARVQTFDHFQEDGEHSPLVVRLRRIMETAPDYPAPDSLAHTNSRLPLLACA